MAEHKISVSTVACDGYSMEEAFEMLARCGAAAVEPAYIEGYVDFEEATFCSSSARTLRHLLIDCGLRAPTISAHIDLGAPDAAYRLNRRINFAAELGATTLITNFTTMSKCDAAIAAIGENLGELERLGLNLALENPGHGKDAALHDGASIRSVVDIFAYDRIRCNFDFCNMYTYHGGAGDPFAAFAGVAELCPAVHLKNVTSQQGDWRFVDLANGELDYGAHRDLLMALPENAVLVVEHPLRIYRPARQDPVRSPDRVTPAEIAAAVAKSLTFLKGLAGHR